MFQPYTWTVTVHPDPRSLAEPARGWRRLCRSSGLHYGALRHEALGHESPQSHEKLARHGDDRNAPHPAARRPDALDKPAADRRTWLAADPHPGQLQHGRSQARIAGLRDPLVAVDATALPGARRQAGIGRNLPAVCERAVE